MKKIILGAVLFLMPLSAFAASFDADLHYGSKGDDVVALQEFLIDQGVLNIPVATGNFYSITLAAVKRFQKAEGVSPVSGYVGPITRGVINGILADIAPDSEGDATTTQTPVDLSQVQIPQSNPIVPISPIQTVTPTQNTIPVASASVPKCNDFSFIASRSGAAMNGYYSASPRTVIESYVFSFRVKTSCTDKWYADYKVDDSFARTSSLPSSIGFFSNPIAGTYSIEVQIHNEDYSIKSATTSITYTSNGTLTEDEYFTLHPGSTVPTELLINTQ